jgi:hypothetical protein
VKRTSRVAFLLLLCAVLSYGLRIALTEINPLGSANDPGPADPDTIRRIQASNFLTTTNVPSGYINPPGGLDDGVVDVRFHLTNSSGTATFTWYGTGQLLPSRRHVLTAAHLTFAPGFSVTGGDVIFRVSGGDQTFAFSAADVSIHPSYTGSPAVGDYAIVRLASLAPSTANPRHIHRGTSELGQVVSLIGYGLSGTGATGWTIDDGQRRAGNNRLDVDASKGNAYFSAYSTLFGAVTIQGKSQTYTIGMMSYVAGDYSVEYTLNGAVHPNGFEWTDGGGTKHRGDQLKITLNSALVTKPAPSNTQLDGHFPANPNSLGATGTSQLPSGDGFVTPQQNFVFRVIVLPGDCTRDNIVDLSDFAFVKDNQGKTGQTYADGDFDGDGDVDIAVYAIFSANVALNWTTWSGPP